MIEIVPTVMPESYKDFIEKIERVVPFVKTIQIDVMDGKFVPSTSWPYNYQKNNSTDTNDADTKGLDLDPNWQKLIDQEEGLPHWQECKFEIDLMVEDQIGEAQKWVSAGVERVIFHIEVLQQQETEQGKEKIRQQILEIKEQGIDISMALVPETSNEILDEYLDILESVQFMGINKIGFQGQEFAPEVLNKISELHAKKPDFPISVDGGVSFKTAKELVSAGATRLASGSTIFKAENAERAIKNLFDMVN